jgi:PAS domain S-box-containing protein
MQVKQSLLSESEQRFRAIFDEAGTGITLVDLMSGMPIQNNRALQIMLGCTQEELSRFETFDELTCAEKREADAASFRELCEGERDTLRQEKHFILRDGRSVWANVIFTLLRDSAGLPRFIIAIHEDITERKHAVETLQAKQDLLDLAQKSARAMAFDWHIQQDVNVWSLEQEALYGLPPGSFDGTYQGWKKLIYPADWPLILAAIENAHETGEVAVEFRVVWPDRSLHWLSTRGQMFFDDQGKPFRMVGFTSDVTPRKLVEEELRRSEDALHKVRSELTHVARVSALGTLTASIAHEVNQPLAGIVINGKTSLRYLEADAPDLNGAREATQRIVRDANRAGEVIARLRSLFKKTGTTNRPLELAGIIQEVLALTNRETQRNKITVRTLFANDMPPVLGDRVQVQQVLLNLILNAVEAMATVGDRPRELTITTTITAEDQVRTAIKDSGPGLDKETEARMFDAFFTNKEHGMGIGLSISRSIVEQHGGKLWAEPQANAGATFLFTLPALHEQKRKAVSVTA